jgi:nitrate/nitrite transport system permease protein
MTATLTMNNLAREARPASTAALASAAAAPETPATEAIATSAAPEQEVVEISAATLERNQKMQLAARRRREGVTGFVQSVFPGPAKVWDSAVKLFSDPFYRKGPNDQGIGWNILASLQRVGVGFGLAALVGIPMGFMIGRFTYLSRMTAPIISILRPVSPLAWLPIGLMVFKAANPAAIWVIFICSIWPMIINTAVGVQRIPQDYLNVARVLNLSEWKVFTKILLPAVLPYMLTGVQLSIGVAWLVIVAAEMLTGGVGIGFWLWDEWNNLVMEHIIIAIFTIGIVGLLLERLLIAVANRFKFEQV